MFNAIDLIIENYTYGTYKLSDSEVYWRQQLEMVQVRLLERTILLLDGKTKDTKFCV